MCPRNSVPCASRTDYSPETLPVFPPGPGTMSPRRSPSVQPALLPAEAIRTQASTRRHPGSSRGRASAVLPPMLIKDGRRRGRIVVLHFAGQMPLAGIAWQAMQYVLGLEQLGFECWYVEDHGANPYDPRQNSVVMDCDYNVATVRRMMAGLIGRRCR